MTLVIPNITYTFYTGIAFSINRLGEHGYPVICQNLCLGAEGAPLYTCGDFNDMNI